MTSERRARGPYANGTARQHEILQAALASFADHGYERSSLRDIAARAGITHAGVLHHFADKTELLTAALNQHEREEREYLNNLESSGASGAQMLAGLIGHDADRPGFARAWVALRIAAADPAHAAHDNFIERQRRLLDEIANGISPRLTDADSQVDPATVATMLLALVSGLQQQRLTDPELDIAGPLQQFLELIFSS